MDWAQPKWFGSRKLEQDYDMSLKLVEKINSALELIARKSNVDPKRIALVGHDFGGMYAMLSLRNEMKTGKVTACAYISVASTPRMSDWFFYNTKLSAEDEALYIRKMGPLDPIRVAAELQVPSLFQFANNDEFISKTSAEQLYKAYAGPKQIDWQDGLHDLNSPGAIKARSEWLTGKLGIDAANMASSVGK